MLEGDHPAAAEHFRRAVEQAPRDVPFRVALAGALAASGRRPAAIDQIDEALRIAPEDATLLRLRSEMAR
jgi:predicted TPR repeat methyltransferase